LRRKRVVVFALVAWLAVLVAATSAEAARYVVVYDHQDVPADAAERMAQAGGRLLAKYDRIGVAVAESDSELFRAAVLRDPRVAATSATDPVGVGEGDSAAESMPGDLPNAPATDADTFSALQWNMRKIQAPEAHAITGGSPSVVVGVIDTGLDATHPDLDGNVDAANSVSCVGGVPNQSPAAWDDDSGHGTHVAGVIAAESNGVGIVGVAPHVKIAAIKASQRVGTRDIFRPEAVVCALMWAGNRHLDVANNSYSVDQELVTDALDFFCRNDPEDKAVIKAVQRASHYATKQGVTLLAAAGNQMLDLANPPLGNECIKMPAELPAFLTVSSTGTQDELSAFSNWGIGVIDVAAPGGNIPPAPPAGFVLSTWPGASRFFVPTLLCDPVQTPCPAGAAGVAYYRFMAGTSQATAHVSGVAALVISRFGNTSSPWNGKLRPGRVEAIIEQTADPIPCPPAPTACEGGETNGFYGHGRVNALRAITTDAG
jgi:lantibiotic leader peptide-processing serine protease